MSWRKNSRPLRKSLPSRVAGRCVRRRVGGIEHLETRVVFDAGMVVLAADFFDARQNDGAATLSVLTNDHFDLAYTGARRITSLSFGSEGGSLSLTADGLGVRYAPPADFFGSETFTYVVDHAYSTQVQVRISAPLAFDQYTIVPNGAERTLDVLSNDPFWSGYSGARQITSVSTTSADSTVTISADGRSLRYMHADEMFGRDEFVYIVDHKYPARVSIDLPRPLVDDRFEMVQNTSQTLAVLANDPFWSEYAGERRITHLSASSSRASMSISADGSSVTYTPLTNRSGWDSFTYVVDGAFEALATVVVHRPVQDDWFRIDANSSNQAFNVIANDDYYEVSNRQRNIVERVTSVESPDQGGSVSVGADGVSVVYTPASGFYGVETFTYVADGLHPARVTVQVERSVRDDYVTTYEDTPNAAIDVLVNDFEGNGYVGPRVITHIGPTTQGGQVSIAPNGKSVRYTPAPGFVGVDEFVYTVDAHLEAKAIVNVTSLAQDDWYGYWADPTHGAFLLRPLENDFFTRGYVGPGAITSVTSPSQGGTAAIVGGNSIAYTPGSAGYETFTYTVDGKYQGRISTSIWGYLQSDSIVADQNSAARSIQVLANDFSTNSIYAPAYRGPRVITNVSQSEQGGVVTINLGSRTVSYQPPTDYYGVDSFTYTVDGVMQAAVQVQVVRRVRDDRFRVATDASAERLPVLVNDLFGADYAGGQQITSVGPSSRGGSATLSADRKSVLYTPAPGFVGVDSFGYTVDGVLKAEVEVVVGATRQDQFPVFGSAAAYEEFLVADALKRYEHMFGQPAYYGCWLCEFDGMVAGAPRSEGNRSHSETNVQVAGVDEGDIIEFDADFAYVLRDDELVIVDAWPVEQMSVISRVEIEGTAVAEYLHGDRLTIVSTVGGTYLRYDSSPFVDVVGAPIGGAVVGGDVVGRGFRGFPPFPFPPPLPHETRVTVLDVSDRRAPKVVQTTSMEGRYVDSRAVGDYVYALVSNDSAVAPPPLVIDDDLNALYSGGTYETREAYLNRVTANSGELIAAALPNYTSYGPNGEVVRTGLLNDPADVYRPLQADVQNLITVASFAIEENEPGIADSSAIYASGASAVYASLDNFYVLDGDYNQEDGALTRIVKFDWHSADGGIEFAATTTVPGTMINQFSADEHEGLLRIATTVFNSGSGNWTGRGENMLFVLREDEGVMEPVGSLQNLAINETIRSVRFMGDRAFLTTFQTIDPLFALDLSFPERPRALGHLTLPGYSTYMQMIDETHLLTVGKNTPNGWGGPTQVALFDVSDLTQPRRLDEYTFERYSTSEAEVDHHAFGYFAAHGLLALPTSRTYTERVDLDGDGYRETRRSVTENELAILRIDVPTTSSQSAGIDLVGEISHDTAVRRSGYIDDYLFSIAGDSVKAVRVDAPDVVVAEARIVENEPTPGEGETPPVTWKFPASWSSASSAAAIAAARGELAARLGTRVGDVAMITAEPVQHGMRLVLQKGEARYLYRAANDGKVELVDDSYQFASGDPLWHNVENVSVAIAPDWGRDMLAWQRGFDAQRSADVDRDDDVDGADFLAWQRGSLVARPAGPAAKDDALATWERNFGAASGAIAEIAAAQASEEVESARSARRPRRTRFA